MKNKHLKIKSAIATVLTFTATSSIYMTTSALAATENEKCYGIVKTGANDCQTSTAACAGSATKDKQGDAFIFLPKGTCTKIVGGSLTPITKTKKD